MEFLVEKSMCKSVKENGENLGWEGIAGRVVHGEGRR